MSIFSKYHQSLATSTTPVGFQRKNSPQSPVYTEREIATAIINGTISEESFKNGFEWTGDNSIAAVTNVVSAVLAEKTKLSVTYNLSNGDEVTKSEADRMGQLRSWLNANGISTDSFPMSVTGVNIHVGDQTQNILFPQATPQLSQGAQPVIPAAPTPVGANPTTGASTLDRLFSQLPAGSWRYDGFSATGEPIRRVLFWAKTATKLIVKTADQAKKLIDDDDAEKTDFGWYLVSGWVSSSNGHFKPTPDVSSKAPF